MSNPTKKLKRLRILFIVLLLLLIGFIVFCLVCKNLVFVLRNSDDLDTVLEKIGGDNRLSFTYYGSELKIDDADRNEIDEQDVDKELLTAVRELFKTERVSYIGWSVPGKLWPQVYIGLKSKGDSSEYLVYCKDESELPDYSNNQPAELHWVVGDWYRVVFNGKDPTMGG